ncbi:MAG: hypothetical protein ACYC7A_15885 [Thermoanaerobaculia bacterium]
MTATLSVLALLLVTVFGAPAALMPVARGFSWAARAGLALAFGALTLTISAILLGFAGIPWSIGTLSMLPVVVAASLTWHLSARTAVSEGWASDRAPLIATGVAVAALFLLYAALRSGRSTSPDFVYFWAAKAVRYRLAGGFDPEFLRWPNAIHTHVNYPPLHPLTLAWTAFWSGEKGIWRYGTLSTLLWTFAAVPLLFEFLALKLRRSHAAAVAAFWAAAVTTALASSYSGGNAEAPLLFFVSVGGIATMLDDDRLRAIASAALTGAVLTKLEGAIVVVLIVAGAAARDVLMQRKTWALRTTRLAAWPAAALALWFAYLLIQRAPLTDATREPLGRISFAYAATIVDAMIRNLHAGALGLGWTIPFVIVVFAVRRVSRAHLPGLVTVAGLLAFYYGYYLHAAGDPSVLIGWTLPRTSMPALSLWILTAGLIGASRAEKPANL